MQQNRGFTLVEMVVVLAVVAILAAILVPTVAKNINDAKLARATNEEQVIGAAIASFFKDVGRWPTSDGAAVALPDAVELLYTPGSEPSVGAAPAGEQDWLMSVTALYTNFDALGNQLLTNNPGGGANNYPVPPPIELRWRGPYLTELKADPWGCYYACNIIYTYDTTTGDNMAGVWSAGPDRTAQTDASQLATAVTVGGDDILFRIK